MSELVTVIIIAYFWIGLFFAITTEYKDDKSGGERVIIGWVRAFIWPYVFVKNRIDVRASEN